MREFAKKVGVSSATVARVESGKMPDVETFLKLCKYLKLNPMKLEFK